MCDTTSDVHNTLGRTENSLFLGHQCGIQVILTPVIDALKFSLCSL